MKFKEINQKISKPEKEKKRKEIISLRLIKTIIIILLMLTIIISTLISLLNLKENQKIIIYKLILKRQLKIY